MTVYNRHTRGKLYDVDHGVVLHAMTGFMGPL